MRIAGKVAVTLVALMIAVLAWGSGLDRMSRAAPPTGALVPPPLRSEAWRGLSLLALLEKRNDEALWLAERGVAAAPGNVDAVSRLATVRYVAGDAAGAQRAFRVAGALGWRDRPTQLYWYEAALAQGDYAIAALRLDALLRQQPDFPGRSGLLAKLEQAAAGRRALLGRLAARPEWLVTYVGEFYGTTDAQLAGRAWLLGEAGAALELGCGDVSKLVRELYQRKLVAEARRLFAARCGGRGGPLLDGGFDHAKADDPSPFAWQFAGVGGLDVQLAGGGRERAVVIASGLPAREVFASQVLQLPPGRYRVVWDARDEAKAPSPRIAAALGCAGGGSGFAVGRLLRAALFGVEAEVGDCPLQTLELAIVPGQGAVRVDEVAIAAVR